MPSLQDLRARINRPARISKWTYVSMLLTLQLLVVLIGSWALAWPQSALEWSFGIMVAGKLLLVLISLPLRIREAKSLPAG